MVVHGIPRGDAHFFFLREFHNLFFIYFLPRHICRVHHSRVLVTQRKGEDRKPATPEVPCRKACQQWTTRTVGGVACFRPSVVIESFVRLYTDGLYKEHHNTTTRPFYGVAASGRETRLLLSSVEARARGWREVTLSGSMSDRVPLRLQSKATPLEYGVWLCSLLSRCPLHVRSVLAGLTCFAASSLL